MHCHKACINKNSSHITVENLWLSAVRLIMYPLTDPMDDCGILQNCSYSTASNQIGLYIPKNQSFVICNLIMNKSKEYTLWSQIKRLILQCLSFLCGGERQHNQSLFMSSVDSGITELHCPYGYHRTALSVVQTVCNFYCPCPHQTAASVQQQTLFYCCSEKT